MTATPSIELPGWMAEQLSQASPDLLRQMVQTAGGGPTVRPVIVSGMIVMNKLRVPSAHACGEHIVTGDDFVLGDDDGVVFVPLVRAAEVADLAASIRDTERSQAVHMQLGTSFRSQSRFDDYIAARQSGRDLTFRQHLRAIGGAIEV